MVKKFKTFLKDTSKKDLPLCFCIQLYTVPSFVAILLVFYLIYYDDLKMFFNKTEVESTKTKLKPDDEEDDNYLIWRKRNVLGGRVPPKPPFFQGDPPFIYALFLIVSYDP